MTYRITLADRAVVDLMAIEAWIAEEADWETAVSYTARVKAKIMTLQDFPLRGTPREDLVPGLRTITFERRLIIGYHVVDNEVSIEAVVSASRDEEVWR